MSRHEKMVNRITLTTHKNYENLPQFELPRRESSNWSHRQPRKVDSSERQKSEQSKTLTLVPGNFETASGGTRRHNPRHPVSIPAYKVPRS